METCAQKDDPFSKFMREQNGGAEAGGSAAGGASAPASTGDTGKAKAEDKKDEEMVRLNWYFQLVLHPAYCTKRLVRIGKMPSLPSKDGVGCGLAHTRYDARDGQLWLVLTSVRRVLRNACQNVPLFGLDMSECMREM